jgi:glycosyltransferase involved in cell wall biosynthesis
MEKVSSQIASLKQLDSNGSEKALFEYCYSNYVNKLTPYRLFGYAQKLCSRRKNKNSSFDPMRSNALVTVVTVNYNNKQGLINTVNSVLKQTKRSDIQHIIVDGNSTDGSLEYLRQVESKIDIAVYGNDSGVYEAMNRGIDLASSNFTIFMNSGDCFNEPTVVEEFLEVANENDSADFIYGAARLEDKNIWHPKDPGNIWKGMICSHQSAFFKTNLIKKFGGYSLENTVVSDYQLIAKLYSSGADFCKTDIVISCIEPVGISADFNTRTIERWKVIRELPLKGVTPQQIDELYRDLLTTNGEFTNPHNHTVNYPQTKLISNVEKRVCFLISMPRSGSTLLQNIINKSDDIATAGEPWFMLPLASLYDENLITAQYGQHLNVMAKKEFVKDTGLINIIENAQKVYADSIYSATVEKYGKRYFLDKTPRYVHIIDKLALIYPNAKFIVLKRNPAAVISSYANTWYSGDYDETVNDPYAKYDFEHGFSKLADFCDSDFSNKIVINYEDLVKEPENVALKVFNYLGLSFDDDFINYNTKDANAKDAIAKFAFGDPTSVYSKSRPDPSHSDKWINSISDNKQAKKFLTTLDLVPALATEKLGYDLQHIRKMVISKFSLTLPKLADLELEFGKSLLPQENHNKHEARLGVLITCYNNEYTIKNAIESVIDQSKTPDLILISDDCSTDGSIDAVKKIIGEEKNKNIQLIERAENVGVSKNRDLAIREMDVDYISTLDGDDLFYPGKLEAEYHALEDGKCAVSFSDIIILGEKDNILIPTKAYNLIPKDKMLTMVCGREAPVPRDMMFSKRLFLKAKGFDQDMEIYEDWAFKMRLIGALDEGEQWIHSGVIGTVYDRRNPGLSGKKAIFHAYGQLLALARNASLLSNNNEALSAGLITVAQSLESNTKNRLLKFASSVKSKKDNSTVVKKLDVIWRERRQKLLGKEINELIWYLSNNKDLQIIPCKFVICTPVFNAEATLERTILSVIEQAGNFDIHYHIQDAGSTDGTLELIKAWKSRVDEGSFKIKCNSLIFTYDSAKDAGMYDALAKAFGKVPNQKTDWLSWINADDYFKSNAFKEIGNIDNLNDSGAIKWITGMCSVLEFDGSFNNSFRPMNSALIKRGLADGANWEYLQQEGTFFKAELWDAIDVENGFSRFRYAGDWNLWRQMANVAEVFVYRSVLAHFCKVEGQLSQVNKTSYEAEISAVIPSNQRKQSFMSFPVSEGEFSILQYVDGKLQIVKGNILGQFAYKFSNH